MQATIEVVEVGAPHETVSDGCHVLVERAKALEPDIELDVDIAVQHMRARAISPAATDEVVRAVYLCCACAQGVDKAHVRFEELYVPCIERAARKLSMGEATIADIRQNILELLLVGDATHPPKALDYQGTGDFRTWLRVVTTRAGLRRLKTEKPERFQSLDATMEAQTATDDPELAAMKATYAPVFREAFVAALQRTGGRDRTLLVQHFVDGLTIDDLAALHGAHRSSTARWLRQARETLLGLVREEFAARTHATREEFDSVLKLVRSRFDVTIRGILSR